MPIQLLATVELRLTVPDSTDPGKITPGLLAAVLGDLVELDEDPDTTPFGFHTITVTHIGVAEPPASATYELSNVGDDEYWHNRCHATFFERTAEIGVDPLTTLHSFTNDEHVEVDVSTSFTAKIYGDPDTQRMFVFWTDWVANDWYQEVANLAAGHEFLAALTTAVNEGRELTDDEQATAGMP